MKSVIRWFCLVAIGTALVATAGEFKSLFNGSNLDAWEYVGGGKAEVVDGMLRLTNQKEERNHGILFSKRTYGDFTVRLKFKSVKGNSGLYFRSEKRLDHPVKVAGFQAEIDPAKDVGGLYETLGRAWVVQPKPEAVATWFKPGEWNEMKVTAKGRDVTVWVNGKVSAELRGDSGRTEGYLGMQVHGGQDVEAWFKDIEISVLP